MRAPRLFLLAALAAASIAGVSVAAAAEPTWEAAVVLEDTVAAPGQTVAFTGGFIGDAPADVEPDACVVEIDGSPAAIATCGWDIGGPISGQFTVPETEMDGNVPVVSVCWPGCYNEAADDVVEPYWQDDVLLEVVVPKVAVPDVTGCKTVSEATDILGEAGLAADAGDAELDEVVTGQVPDSQELVTPGTPVSLIVGTVTVPDVVGSTYDDAKVELDEACLGIGTTTGTTGGTVEVQDPVDGTEVAGGDVVRVTMDDPSGPIPTRDPGASEPVSSDVRPVLVGAGVLLLLLVVASVLANRLTRGRRDLVWLGEHVNVAAGPPGPTRSATRAIQADENDHVISVVAQEVTRSTTVEEEP